MPVNDKREEARKKLANVQRKINRLRRERGAELSGTQHDIRVDPSKIKRYNSKQLDAFIQRANGFLDRRVQFVGLRGGTPAPLGKARQLEALERQYNARGNSVMDKIGPLQAPFSTKTIADRDADMRPNVKAGGEPVARTFEAVGTRFKNIESINALDKFIEYRQKQLSDEYAPARVKAGREQLDKMLTRMGADDSRAAANSLTDEQFFVFWEYGPYAGDVALQYEITKRSHEEHRPLNRDEAKDIDDIDSELKETLDWASNLPSDLNLGLAQAQQRSKSQRATRKRPGRR